MVRNRIGLIILLCSQIGIVFSQDMVSDREIGFTNFDAFDRPGKNWIIAGDVMADPSQKLHIAFTKGTGVAVNDFTKNEKMHLVTKQEYGDVEVELDFMMANNSNAGVYLQGRYEVQLFDSWKKINIASSDLGGIYMRWQSQRGTFEGTSPYLNVARAPGLWQHLYVRFKAARFDDAQKKIQDAVFEEVVINGVRVQTNVAVTGPTASSMFNNEQPLGPLIIQGDHGPLAIKNLSIKRTDTIKQSAKPEWWDMVDPVIVEPGRRTSFVRAFAEHNGKKLTHVISFGNPQGVSFSYNLKQGSIFNIWRGGFVDMTKAWHGRGEPQQSTPVGSVIGLTNALPFNLLENLESPWMDTVAFDSITLKGFSLNKDRCPTFKYNAAGVNVSDSIFFSENGDGISRTLRLAGPTSNAYCRIADAEKIEILFDGLYVVGDKKYYVRIDKKYKPLLRKTKNGQELLVKYDDAQGVTYSLVW